MRLQGNRTLVRRLHHGRNAMKIMTGLPRHFWIGILTGTVLLLASMGLYWQSLERKYLLQLDEAASNARLRAEEAAHALSRQMYSQLKGIDFVVHHLGVRWLQEGEAGIRSQIEPATSYFPAEALQLVAVTDAAGQVLFSEVLGSRKQRAMVSLADRDYFREHQRLDTAHFSISLPVVNLYTGDWTLQFSHSLLRDGKFDGIVLVSISAGYLADAFKAVYPDPDDVVLLTTPAGEYLTRSHRMADALGKSVQPDRSFLQQPDNSHGFYEAKAPVDGIERFYSWYRLEEYPAVLVLGLGKGKVLGPVLRSIEQSRQQNLRASMVLLVALLVIFYLSLIRARQGNALMLEQERLSTLLAYFPAGVLLEDERGRVVSVNRNFGRMLGLGKEVEQLAGTSHMQVLQHMSPWQRDWFRQLSPGQTARRNMEVSTGRGQAYEISWVAIQRKQRALGHVWLVQDISERKRKESELISRANTDPLTGLANRRSFMELLDVRIQSGQGVLSGAVLMLDIDHFKRVNDSWGHPVGDEVLKTVARIIASNLRDEDYAGRLGGEEFAVLLSTTQLDESIKLAERIRGKIAASCTLSGADSIQVTISIGLCMLDGQDAHNVLVRADRALYQAKERGRNRVCVATADMA